MVTSINFMKFYGLSMIYGFTWQSIYIMKINLKGRNESYAKKRERHRESGTLKESEFISSQFTGECSHPLTIIASPGSL